MRRPWRTRTGVGDKKRWPGSVCRSGGAWCSRNEGVCIGSAEYIQRNVTKNSKKDQLLQKLMSDSRSIASYDIFADLCACMCFVFWTSFRCALFFSLVCFLRDFLCVYMVVSLWCGCFFCHTVCLLVLLAVYAVRSFCVCPSPGAYHPVCSEYTYYAHFC